MNWFGTILGFGVRKARQRVGGSSAIVTIDEASILAAEKLRNRLSPHGPLICFAGRFNEQSGLSYLVEALRALPDVRAILAGDGVSFEDTEALIEGSGLTHRVELMKTEAMAELQAVVLASDLVVLPLLAYVEAAPAVLSLAGDCCRPAIVTNPLRAYLKGEQPGVLVQEGNSEALRQAMQELLGMVGEPSVDGRADQSRSAVEL